MLKNMFFNLVAFTKSSSNATSVNGYSSMRNQTLDVGTNRMVWMDLEMTGLEVETDKIMEVACIITDENLNIVAEGPDLIIHQPKDILDNMNEWCTNQHRKTGLTDKCLNSNININEAEDKIFEFIAENVSEKTSPLAGNSVYMDRLFLRKYMPKVHNYLHYRIIDVSTVKELCRRWNPELHKSAPRKNIAHRALSDIKESIEELKFYRNNFCKLSQM